MEKHAFNELDSQHRPPSRSPDVEIGAVIDPKPQVATRDGDEALNFLQNQDVVDDLTPEEEGKLVRKIDWMIMPLMWNCYMLQYLDKTLVNYAAVMGLYDDANINTDRFSNLALFFYVSYLLLEFPHGYGMQRLPTAKYLGTMISLWGLITAITCVR